MHSQQIICILVGKEKAKNKLRFGSKLLPTDLKE